MIVGVMMWRCYCTLVDRGRLKDEQIVKESHPDSYFALLGVSGVFFNAILCGKYVLQDIVISALEYMQKYVIRPKIIHCFRTSFFVHVFSHPSLFRSPRFAIIHFCCR